MAVSKQPINTTGPGTNRWWVPVRFGVSQNLETVQSAMRHYLVFEWRLFALWTYAIADAKAVKVILDAMVRSRDQMRTGWFDITAGDAEALMRKAAEAAQVRVFEEAQRQQLLEQVITETLERDRAKLRRPRL